MLNQIILDKIRLLRTILADAEMDPEDRQLAEDLLRAIEEQARK